MKVILQKVKLILLSHSTITTFLLIGSVLINVLLAIEVKTKNQELLTLQNGIEYDKGVLPGEVVPGLSVFDSLGQKKELLYTDSPLPTVLYVFTPDCHWCAKNLENIKLLDSQTNKSYRFIGISLRSENLAEYVKDSSFGFPVYNSPPKEVFNAYKMGRTPQTFVISTDGHVITTWAGAFSGQTKKEVEEFFKVKLPEIE